MFTLHRLSFNSARFYTENKLKYDEDILLFWIILFTSMLYDHFATRSATIQARSLLDHVWNRENLYSVAHEQSFCKIQQFTQDVTTVLNYSGADTIQM